MDVAHCNPPTDPGHTPAVRRGHAAERSGWARSRRHRSFPALRPSPGVGGAGRPLVPPTGVHRSRTLVAAFVAVRLPAPPGWTRRRGHCLAAPPLAPATPTCGPLPSRGLLPVDRRPGPEAPPRRPVGLPQFDVTFARRLTSLGGVTPQDRTAWTPLPEGHDRGGVLPPFRGPESASCPLPPPPGLFAVRPRVFRRTHWQALDAPLVVELFVLPLVVRGMPGCGRQPDPPVSRSGTPHASGVTRTLTGLPPELPRGWSPSSPRRDSHPLRVTPARRRWPRRRVFPGRPRSRGRVRSGRTARLCPLPYRGTRFYRAERPSHWANPSPGTQRYEPALTRRLVRPRPFVGWWPTVGPCRRSMPPSVTLRASTNDRRTPFCAGECRSVPAENPDRTFVRGDRPSRGPPRNTSRTSEAAIFRPGST
jgi:hypothetical protein